MQWLSTGLCTVLLILTAYSCMRAVRAAELAVRHARKIETSLGRLIKLEGACEQLDATWRKLSGKFHAHMRDYHPNEPEVSPSPAAAYQAPAPLIVCENWHLSTIEGPTSRAASCACEYCEWQRAERARMRATHTPKGQPARLGAIKRGLES